MSCAVRPPRPTYTLALLSGVYFFYLLDRNAVLVTQELFKTEFGLSDTQVGVATGLSYGVFYALVGLPLGAAVDRTNRSRLLAMLVTIWSGVTMLCALAGQFWHLVAARAVVGGAESGGSPTSLSILSDLYPPSKRATVSSIFFAGAGVGSIVSFLLGGYIAQHFGWRAVFLIYGAPGLILAALILFTVVEPPRRAIRDGSVAQKFWHTSSMLIRDRGLLLVYCGSVAWTLSISGVGSWMVPYLMRVHSLPVATAGVVVALGLGLLATLGSIAFGFASDWLERKRTGRMLTALAVTSAFNGLAGVALALSDQFALAMVCFGLWGTTAIVYSGPANAAIAGLAPERARGVGFALFAVLCNLIGGGLGPLLTGILSDRLTPSLGAGAISGAIGLVAVIQLIAAIAFFRAARHWRARKVA